MQFIKTRDVKSPERNVSENAGIDIYIPNDCETFRADLQVKNIGMQFVPISVGEVFDSVTYMDEKGTIHIAPHQAVIIPTGIRSKFSPNIALIANNKSGIATKKQLIFGASVIDASYQGEWHVNLINTSNYYQTIDCGQKAIQFIPHIISTDEIEILDLTPEEFYTEKTNRGDGWAGSTGVR